MGKPEVLATPPRAMEDIVDTVVGLATPTLREIICAGLEMWENTAAETDGRFDDFVVKFLKALLLCK
jgi:hypothetical protein